MLDTYRVSAAPSESEIKIKELPIRHRFRNFIKNVKAPEMKFLNSIYFWLIIGAIVPALAFSYLQSWDKTITVYMGAGTILWGIALRVYSLANR